MTKRTGGTARFAILLGALTALGPLANDTYLPSLPQIADDLNATASATQLSLTACLVGLGSGQMIAGPISDRLGRRGPLLAGLLLFVAAALACSWAPNVWTLVVLRLLQGIGGATGIVIASAIVRDRHTGVQAARLFSLLMLVTGMAPILAPVAGGQLLRMTDWRGIFLALTAAGAVILLACTLLLPETHPVQARTAPTDSGPVFGRLLKDRQYVGYMLSCGFAFAAMFAYIAGSPFVLQEIHHMSPQAFSYVFGINALGLVVAAQTGGRIVHKSGPRRLLGLGVSGSALGGVGALVCAVTHAPLPALLVSLFVIVTSVGLVMPNSMALAMNNHGEIAGAAAALIGFLQHIIGAAMVPLVGLAGKTSALPMGITTAALGIAALASFTLITRPDPDPADLRPVAVEAAR
ncbi:multidrug effflux MFS transporter [Streptomyces alanosinicus]|uniref:Bcr/CflA family drug resistance efflux transporter n=1 Tax=Streptomyces alanosinicus TaxID=68171 RepID=A0A919D4Q7_9ACTN|nr:multidrug effflux MFS transporter [Streptomyces alanosinicus]GHE10277.1 Bcr/CflA family drug resistance efflux transporter [Streptomyces alanosinicus]